MINLYRLPIKKKFMWLPTLVSITKEEYCKKHNIKPLKEYRQLFTDGYAWLTFVEVWEYSDGFKHYVRITKNNAK